MFITKKKLKELIDEAKLEQAEKIYSEQAQREAILGVHERIDGITSELGRIYELINDLKKSKK